MIGASACAVAVLLAVLPACHADPEVTTGQGTVQGIYLTTSRDRNISAFLGIPFAQPPVGDLRFKNPVAAGSWNGTYDATEDASMCPQFDNTNIVGDEDCLYLNVYTPRLPDDGNTGSLPVMFYVHGGAFVEGSSDSNLYGPEYLLDRDVVLVVTNYRLGVLGFLSTGDSEAPGNFGLKDQVMALRWTQENIKYFGGDPDKVTLFGESAGGSSVFFLTLSDLTEGLFHQYIIESGPNLAMWTYAENFAYIAYANTLGEHLGCPTNTSALLVDCLREVNVSTILDTNSIFYIWGTYPDNVWIPTVEPNLDGALITDSASNLVAAGKMKDLPSIVGVVRDEGLVFTGGYYMNERQLEVVLSDFDNAMPHILNYYGKVDDVAEYTAGIKSYYFNNDLTSNITVLLSNFTDLASDIYFVYPAVNLLEQYLAFARNPTFFCSFEYRGTFSYSYKFTGGNTNNFGVAHADDLIYLFPQRESVFGDIDDEMSETDMKMVDILVDLWTSFAINGTPTTSAVSSAETWQAYSLHNSYLQIGSDSDVTPYVESSLREARMEFWRELTAVTVSGADSLTPTYLVLPLVVIHTIVQYSNSNCRTL